MDELECMRTIDQSLQGMPDDTTRTRIANWVASKYLGLGIYVSARKPSTAVLGSAGRSETETVGEIAGIAKLSQSGEVQLTVRDFKAKSTNDAAIRLVHVLIWATKKLTGEASASSKHSIVPWLRKYRCYDGNTRGAIAKDKGLVRDGDQLSLDFHAEQNAERFMEEILNPEIEGKWKPGPTKRRTSRISSDSEMGAM